MSTNDVPGFNAANGDTLAMGAWAEHDDGSLIVVESTEHDRVVYSIFDMAKTPIVEYRDAKATDTFKKMFSFGGAGTSKDRWTWHDKTPFQWDRVIKQGAQDGVRYASADDQLTAAQRVADSLHLRAQNVSRDLGHRAERIVKRSKTAIYDKLMAAVDQLGDSILELQEMDENEDE